MNDNAEFKLSTSQKQKIHYNSCLFQLNTNQNDVFQSQLSSFKSKYPNSHEILLVESYALVKAKNTKQAIKVLSDYCTQCKTFSEIDLKLIFLLAQLLIKEQNLTSASRFIENLTNFKYHPVVVSVLYLLYEQTEDIKSIESLFKNAIHWHETNKVNRLINFNNPVLKFLFFSRVQLSFCQLCIERLRSFIWTRNSHKIQ